MITVVESVLFIAYEGVTKHLVIEAKIDGLRDESSGLSCHRICLTRYVSPFIEAKEMSEYVENVCHGHRSGEAVAEELGDIA